MPIGEFSGSKAVRLQGKLGVLCWQGCKPVPMRLAAQLGEPDRVGWQRRDRKSTRQSPYAMYLLAKMTFGRA